MGELGLGVDAELRVHGGDEVDGKEQQEGNGDEPFDPWQAHIEGRTLREVDAEEHEAERHRGLNHDVPKECERKSGTTDLEGVDEERVEVAEDSEDEPGMGIAGTSEDDPEAGEDAEDRYDGEDDLEDDLPNGATFGMDGSHLDERGLDGGGVAARELDFHHVACGQVVALIVEDSEAAEGLSVDAQDGVVAGEACLCGLGLDGRDDGLRTVAIEGSANHRGAVHEDLQAETCAAECVQKRKRGYDGEKKILETRWFLRHTGWRDSSSGWLPFLMESCYGCGLKSNAPLFQKEWSVDGSGSAIFWGGWR